MMSSALPRPAYDPELLAALVTMGFTPTLAARDVARLRLASSPTAESKLAGRSVSHEERQIDGPDGPLTISIFRPEYPAPAAPGIFHTHGGGMIVGNRFLGVETSLDYVERHGAVCVSVEYRLSPEYPFPASVEDSYAALVWTADHADELGIDRERLLITGSSAGGGIAAGVALLARDRTGPKLHAQLLICPMLDDRDESVSSAQYVDEGTWSRGSNRFGWTSLLGDRRAGADVSIYAAPARAVDLSGLPPAFIDAGSAEVFRDEAVAYASRLWACGVQAELHVWPGGFHGFDLLVPDAALSQVARTTRDAWVARTFSR